jgi:predicted Zn-dependent protease
MRHSDYPPIHTRAAPVRGQSDPDPVLPRFFSEDDCRTLIDYIASISSHRGKTSVQLDSVWSSSIRWARNRSSVASDNRDTTIAMDRGLGHVWFNQTGPASLRAAVDWAEKMGRLSGSDSNFFEFAYAPPDVTYPKTHIWSEPTYQMTSDERGKVANTLIANAEHAGMLSAGYLDVLAGSRHLRLPDGRMCYARYTAAECSMTVRDPNGKGSGWAGASSYDWGQIDAEKLAEIALDKCLKSRNPVRIEPGRYTVILEPQATYDLIQQVMVGYMSLQMEATEIPGSPIQFPFHEGHKVVSVSKWGDPVDLGVTKIGQRLLDPRVTISFDPEDPRLGAIPFTLHGDPLVPVTWWEGGVLKTLAYERGQGPNSAKLDAQPNPGVYRMSGGTTTIDEMIATTERGLLVTRFWGVGVIDRYSILCSGVTRDGLWLIEHGKIKHPVTNLRFTESPLFVLNNVEQLGVPVPVFAPQKPALVPPMKVRDFSFTSMIDAV